MNSNSTNSQIVGTGCACCESGSCEQAEDADDSDSSSTSAATNATANNDNAQRNQLIQLGLGVLPFVAGFILPDPTLSFAAFLVSYLILGWRVLYKAVHNLFRGKIFDENFLMSIATIGAFAIGKYAEGAAVMLFYLVGMYFQNRAINKSKRSIAELMDIRPDFATLVEGDKRTQVDPSMINVGDIIIVKPGEKIPLDGTVTAGRSLLDTRALTGESVPRNVTTGEEVLSGTLNLDSALTIKVTAAYKDSTVARIIELVENARSKKAATENFITTFARYYTPLVVTLASLLAVIPPLFFAGSWEEWLYRALVFLVISCPCALVVSIPLSYFSGIGTASRNGVLVKGSNYLDALTKLDIVALDKTGTLTEGIFKVCSMHPAEGHSIDDLIDYATKAELLSNHPIAHSISQAHNEMHPGCKLESPQDFREVAGHGISATVGDDRILAGNSKFMVAESIPFTECPEVGTKLYVAVNGAYLGCIVIADEVKADSKHALKELKQLGVRKIAMLTGDNAVVARDVGKKLALGKTDEVHAELLPQDKVSIIEQLDAGKRAGKSLGFVGDGINDAPVLARADVGIAMGGLGSDAAIEAADVVLMTDEPSKLASGIKIARATRRIVVQNIVFVLGVKAAFMLMAALGVAGIWEAVFADVGVTLIAVLNAMRILRTKI
ncbi:MAG: cadmium-translocating P-type ATPase [Coriobacteriia bacterium]|nr:cadmium-translocating P-type ATPase [Coriobacteriia bacterium]